MSMQSPRDLREWQKAVERGIVAAKGGARMAVAHADKGDTAVKEEVDTFKRLTPAAPVELVYQTSTYLDAAKRRRGKVTVDFPDVIFSTTGEPIGVYNYELAGQDQGENPLGKFVTLGTSADSSVTATDLNPGSTWKFRVRAMSGSTVKAGLWSTETDVQIVVDTTPPAQPSTPVVTAHGGYLKVVWDGLAAGGAAMPGDFSHLEVASGMSTSPTAVVDTFTGASFAIVPKTAYNTTHFFRFRAFDTSGNASAWSAQATGIPTPLVDVDIILSRIDAATTLIENIGSESIKTGAILSTKLADNAVTQAKLADQAISLAKLDTAVNDKITKGITDAATAQAAANTANTAAGTAQTAADKAKAAADDALKGAVNVVRDPGFETSFWATAKHVISTAEKRTGAQSIGVGPNLGTNAIEVATNIPVAAGQVWRASVWHKTTADFVPEGSWTKLRLSKDGGTGFLNSTNFGVSSSGWTKTTFDYTVPAATSNLSLQLCTAHTGGTIWFDDVEFTNVTLAKSALDAAAAAQAKADSAFADAQTALTNAGLAQTAANGKNSNYYGSTAPAGTGFKVNDNWFRSTDNRVHRWDGSAWVAIADTAIAAAQTSANSAAAAASTADSKAVAAQSKADQATIDAANAKTAGDNAAAAAATADSKAVTAQTKANKAETDAANAKTAGDNAAILANSIVKTSTSAATGAPPSVGALWNQTNTDGSLIIKTWTANAAGTAWVLRKLDDAVIGNLNAATINAGIISAARFNAADIRAKFIEAGKITASDIVANTLTSASGVFGVMDASVINAGTLNAARFNAADIRAKFIEAGKITAADMVANTLTSASGVFGTMDASVINAGTLNAARLNAGDVRAKFLEAGKITAGDMVTNTITAASGVIGSLDIGKVTTGLLKGIYIETKSIRAEHLLVSDPTNFAPSQAESPDDWTLTGDASIVDTSFGTSGKRFNFSSAAGSTDSRAYGPYKAVRPDEMLWGSATIYRTAGNALMALRYQFYDKDKAYHSYLDIGTNTTSGSGAVISGAVKAPSATVAYARLVLVHLADPAAASTAGFYDVTGYRQNTSVLIADGAVTGDKVEANSVAAKVGSFLTINVSQLNATTASLGTAVIDKLWTDVVRSRSITTDMLNIGRGDNMIAWNLKASPSSATPHVPMSGGVFSYMTDAAHSGVTSLYVTGQAVTSGTWTQFMRLNSGFTSDNGSANHWNAIQDGKLVIEAWFRGGGTYTNGYPKVRFQVAFLKADKSFHSIKYSTELAIDLTWKNLSYEFNVPSNAASIYIYLQQDQPGNVRVDDLFMAPQYQASLISSGAILAPHLTVTEEMWAKIIRFKKLEGGEIDVNALNADTAWIGSLRGGILINDAVTTSILKADAITSKHTITGATVQTHAAATTGIKLTGSNLKAYNSGGAETFSVIGSTGDVSMVGSLRTGLGTNYIDITANASGGIARFFTGNGSGRGTVWARDDGDPRMSLAYSNLDEPSGTLPVVVLKSTEAYLNYGSRTIKVWNNAGVEELLLDATNASVVLRGNLDMRSGRIQLRYNNATPLGYVGQAPASGASPDLELRADAGSIRLVGLLRSLSTYNSTTTLGSNMVVSASGDIMRSTSASRYKADQREMSVPVSVLDVKLKDWIDKAEVERKEALEALPRPFLESQAQQYEALDLRRVPGLIAEDLEEAGAGQFVIYGSDGQTEGVMYERFAYAQIDALLARLEAAEARIADLEAAVPR